MSQVEERLAALGLTVPEVAAPVAAYVPAVRTGNLVFISDLLEQADPRAIRLALMHHHYRSGFEWYDAEIQDGSALLHRLLAAAAATGGPDASEFARRVRDAIDDDLDATVHGARMHNQSIGFCLGKFFMV